MYLSGSEPQPYHGSKASCCITSDFSDYINFTYTEIAPPGAADDFLHPGPVSRGEREAEEEAEDVVEVVAEVEEHGEEAEAPVREGRPQENLNQSDQNTRH